ncbi:MAG: hypothetical protein QM765_36095 [Myxococcales bacterium]
MNPRLRVVLSATAMAALLSSCGGPEAEPSPDAAADASAAARDAGPEAGADAAQIADTGLPALDAASFLDAGEATDAELQVPDAAEIADAGMSSSDASQTLSDAALEAADSGSSTPDTSFTVVDAGAELDAGQASTDAGTAPDTGHPGQDAGGATPDGGDPHANANKLEYCGSSASLPAGRAFTVTLNNQTIDFAGGYFWGIYSPETPEFYGDSTFTWVSTDGQYYLELMVHQGFPGSCPVTLALPNDQVVWNLYDTATPPNVDLYSSDTTASGSLKLDFYDLAGGACFVSVECSNCRLVWGSDVAVINGRAVESCQ